MVVAAARDDAAALLPGADAPMDRPTPATAATATAASSAGASATTATATALVGWEDLGDAWAADDNGAFLAKLVGLSVGLAVVAKLAPGLAPDVDLGPQALSGAAAAVIVVPTLLNVAKWQARSAPGAEDFAGDI